MTSPSIDAGHSAPRKHPHRVLYNEDFMEIFQTVREPMEERHVHAMVDEVAAGGADVLLVNPNAQRTNFPSRVWQPFWQGYDPGDLAFFGETSESNIQHGRHGVGQMKHLADTGCDYLLSALARCREKGMAPGVSLRMNDVHFTPWKGSRLQSSFYMEHPHLRLPETPRRFAHGKGLNYEHAPVREHFLALIREMVEGYDFDVMELDFLRAPFYFPEGISGAGVQIMNEFLREVRKIVGGAAHPVQLLVRIAAGIAPALALGFDVRGWNEERLVDGVVIGAYRGTQWRLPVEEFRELTGTQVAVYACADALVDRREGLPMRRLPSDPDFLRGFAAGHLAAGADGFEFYNFFLTKHSSEGNIDPDHHAGDAYPAYSVLGELGSLDSLSGSPKAYTLMSGWMNPDIDGFIQVPAAVGRNEVRQFEMLLAAEPAASAIKIKVLFSTETAALADTLQAELNLTPLGQGQIGPFPGNPSFLIAEFHATGASLRPGVNKLKIRNLWDPLTVKLIDICVAPPSIQST